MYIKGNVRGYAYRGRSLETLLFTHLHDSNAVISGKFLAIRYSTNSIILRNHEETFKTFEFSL